MEGSKIGSHSWINNSIIGWKCKIGKWVSIGYLICNTQHNLYNHKVPSGFLLLFKRFTAIIFLLFSRWTLDMEIVLFIFFSLHSDISHYHLSIQMEFCVTLQFPDFKLGTLFQSQNNRIVIVFCCDTYYYFTGKNGGSQCFRRRC